MKEDLKIAIRAALKAGAAIMKVYESDMQIEYKDDKSPLTQADKEANTVINSFLNETEHPIISEENKQVDYNIRKAWDTCWIVDPLDGTKEFIKRNGEFTVNIALVKKGAPLLSVIYVPDSKTLYFADIEEGAFKCILDDHNTVYSEIFKKSYQLKPENQDTNTIRIVGSRSHMNPETLKFIENLKENNKSIEIVSKGSSLKFCLLAEGKADVYPRFAPTMEWDTAAGQAICSAVGIDVISQETEQTLSYNKENLLNPWFVVAHNER